MNWTWLYIGVLYAGAVALARRGGVDLPKKVALFFYALVLVFFFKPLTQQFIITQDDYLNTLPPWYVTASSRDAINDEMNDIPLQHTAWGLQVRQSWKSLKPPLWNALAGSGYPLLANGQSQGLSPIRLLALPVPDTYFMAAEAAMKILIALTFAFLFCRGRGYSELASVVGAAIFGFGGFLHSWLHFPHVTAACWLPAVLYLIDRIAEGTGGRAQRAGDPAARDSGSPAPRAPRPAPFIAAALVWTAILFGGHPETASHIFFLSLLYLVWVVFVEKRAHARVFLTLGGAMTVAALLAAPFLLPFLEALPQSQRYAQLEVAPLSAVGQPYADLRSAMVLLQAHYFGRAPQEEPWSIVQAELIGGFTGVLGIAAFFGLLAHVVRRRAWRSPECFFIVATVIVFGVIDAWPLIGDAVHAVLPVVAHARFRLLFVLLMGIQAAAAIDLAQRGEKLPFVAGGAVVAALLIALFAAVPPPSEHYRMVALLTSARSVAVIALAVLFAFLPRKPVLLALLVAVIGELWPVTRAWNPPLPAEQMYRRTPLIAKLEELRDAAPKNEPFRFAGVGPMIFPNTNAAFGLEDIRVHDPMAYDRYMGFLRVTANYSMLHGYYAWLDGTSASVLDFLNVRYITQDPGTPPADPERWRLVLDSAEGKIYENKRWLPRFYAVRNVILEFRDELFIDKLRTHDAWAHTALLDDLKLESPQERPDFFAPRPENAPLAVAKIVSAEPTAYRVHVSAPRWSLVVSSIPWWPGWKVVRNGARVEPVRVNGAFLAFAVPPGETDVQVYYSPWTWWVGCGLAALGLLILGVRWRGWWGGGSRRSGRAGEASIYVK
ncbi:MAG TPA: YfhO family protein [Thermoanaerobaculia bacterium]|nr:YfhO family protein [Thermoanaerobaculia bacterium]